MTGSFYPGPWDKGEAFTRAAEYLGKKAHRPIANNTRLARVDSDAIAVVLHSTAVVTYHRDGTFTLYGGGYNTVTTKARINAWSPARPASDGHGAWVVGYTGETTPARVQKCRTCKGRGRWVEPDQCYPTYEWSPYRQIPCPHGLTSLHNLDTVHPVTCYRCKGEGRTDYGSKPIPITVTAWDAFKVDRDGTYLGPADKPYAPVSGYPKSHGPSSNYYGYGVNYAPAPAPSAHDYGSELVDSLAEILPNVKAHVTNPAAPHTRGRLSFSHRVAE
jgi:hypothetical protein